MLSNFNFKRKRTAKNKFLDSHKRNFSRTKVFENDLGIEERSYCLLCNRPLLIRNEKWILLMGSAYGCFCDPENKNRDWRIEWINEKYF